jgi:hypothetical protein
MTTTNNTSPIGEDAACSTCNGHGMIGGPSYYSPDEGGEPCPDCNDVAQNGEDAANGAIGEREAFETVMRSRGEDYLYRRDVPGCERYGDYCRQNVQDQWEVWQARAALTAEKVAAEPIYQLRLASGDWRDQNEHSYRNNARTCPDEVRIVYAAPQPAQTQVALTDEQIIDRCKAAGIKWIRPVPDDEENGGFPGMFDMATMDEMRALLGEAGGINADQA